MMKNSHLNSFFVFFVGLFFGIVIGAFLSFLIEENQSSTFLKNKVVGKTLKLPLLAVNEDGEGVVIYANIKKVKGNGKLYFSSYPFLDLDLQESVEKAKELSSKYVYLKDFDFYVDINFAKGVVGGGSGGLAFALGFYCLLKGKSFPKETALTGAIDENGNVLPVGGIIEKAEVAYKNGFKTLYLPKGEDYVVYYEKKEVKKELPNGFYEFITYIPKKMKLSTYLEKKGIKLKIIPVKRFEEVISLCG